MLFSHNWLQKYFNEKLPDPQGLSDLLMTHSFEVEKVEEVTLANEKEDTLLDVDVLPNRAHDCLSHYGMAKEIATLTNLTLNKIKNESWKTSEEVKTIDIKVEDTKACPRYLSVVVEGIKIGPSPEWLKESLEAIGQKSINNIVDATNYVMFSIGQPLHAFDRDKLSGGQIFVRWAKAGEKITTLDNKEVELGETNLIIADGESPLAIAGVKGGKKAEVDGNTTSLVLEAANFKPVVVRKTSRGFAILTDSSKRFENEISPELAEVGMNELVSLIKEIASTEKTKFSAKADIYPRKPDFYKVGFATEDVNKILGINISDKEVEGILNKLNFEYEKVNSLKKVLETAPSFVGVPYESGASIIYDAPNKFDCSSFTSYLFAQAGVAIPRISVDQYVFGKPVEKENLQAGDLVFANTGEGKIHYESIEFLPGIKVNEGVDHVGNYLGGDKVIHSSRYNKIGTEISELSETKQFENIIGYRRMIEDDKERFVVTAPFERLDLRIKQDLVEEIGRIYGFKNIKSVAINPNLSDGQGKEDDAKAHKIFYYTNKIRKILTDLNFNEVYNYSLVESGKVEIENPLASNRGFMRTNLVDAMVEKLEFNAKNAPLLGLEEIKLFEIGKVFPSIDGEYNALAIGVLPTRKMKQSKIEEFQKLTLENVVSVLNSELKTNKLQKGDFNMILELSLDELIEKLPEVESYENVLEGDNKKIRFEKISPYPFMLRDIAVWTNEGTTEQDVLALIKENGGELLVRTALFDVFEKTLEDGAKKTSYAFNMVFQSNGRTLTDIEVNVIMEKITGEMSKQGWEVR